jgi:acetyltransferase-like isoleucine patch superfamily enzyme
VIAVGNPAKPIKHLDHDAVTATGVAGNAVTAQV